MDIIPIQVLLADDDDGDRLLFREAFKELEIKSVVHTIKSGTELLKYLTMDGAILPDLLFLDLNMPGKNGLACLKAIRKNKKLSDIFIAIYSTSASEKDIDETFINGANIYISKPNDFVALKQVLSKAVLIVNNYQKLPLNKSNFLLKL